MGSIDSIQSLVGRLIDSVQSSNERMDSVQAGGMLRRVPLEAIANHMRQRGLRDNAPVDVRGENDPFPPPPYRSDTSQDVAETRCSRSAARHATTAPSQAQA